MSIVLAIIRTGADLASSIIFLLLFAAVEVSLMVGVLGSVLLMSLPVPVPRRSQWTPC